MNMRARRRAPFRRFNVEPLTDQEREYVCTCVRRSRKRLVIKECFLNSQRTMLLGDTEKLLEYAEGRALATGAWIHHGWLTINGKVVDLTLNAVAFGFKVLVPKRVKSDPRYVAGQPQRAPAEYIGKEFDRDDVYELVQSGYWGPMLSSLDALQLGVYE
jgi:hypothetical protein